MCVAWVFHIVAVLKNHAINEGLQDTLSVSAVELMRLENRVKHSNITSGNVFVSLIFTDLSFQIMFSHETWNTQRAVHVASV